VPLGFCTCLPRLLALSQPVLSETHDAVNDTLTSQPFCTALIGPGRWVEIGSGDGVFSYVMHGGSFPLWFDRYLLTDLSSRTFTTATRPNVLQPAVALLQSGYSRWRSMPRNPTWRKIREIGFAKHGKVAAYEALPLPSASGAEDLLLHPSRAE